jgi:antitoxin component YwqK of YwqJK toxin-antitoxin module
MKNKLSFLILLLISFYGKAQTKIEKYPNGAIKSEIPTKNNQRNGIAKFYFENGKLESKVEFKDDTVVGIVRKYFEDGNLQFEINTETLDGKIYSEENQTYSKGKIDVKKNPYMNGVWEEWEIKGNFKRFEWTYVHDVKDGPYTAFRKDKSIEAKGFYKNGSLSDTLKFYDEKEKLYEMQIWKVDSAGTESTLLNTINLTDKKSDGTVEIIDGQIYMWANGKKTIVGNVDDKDKK